MIQRIKKIVTFFVLVTSIVIFGNCKQNNKKITQTKDIKFDTIYKQSDLTTTLEKDTITYDNYKLIDVQRFFKKPIEQSFLNEVNRMKLKINKDFIYLTYQGNEGYLPYQLKTISAQKYFGKGSLYEYYTEYLKNKYKINVDKDLTYLSIDSSTPLAFPFKPFFYKNYTIITDQYIFFYSYEDYILTFEKESKDNLKELFNSLKSESLPLNIDFNFVIEKPYFININDSYRNILELNNLKNYSGITLPNINKNIKVMLVSAYQDSGEVNLFLYTLSQDYKVIEKANLYYIEGETDSGKNIGRQVNNISKDYLIKVTDYLENGKELEKTYKINDLGKFIEVK
jgi:hypothetical protein